MVKTAKSTVGTGMSRMVIVFCVMTAMFLVMSGTAFANFGPHGGYGAFTGDNGDGVYTGAAGEVLNPDTDACAGCHRAHSAVSAITYDRTPGVAGDDNNANALLIGTTASTVKEFCYTCHADSGAGASTNVQSGVYDDARLAGGIGYETSESDSGVLNGGGFEAMGGAGTMSSTHDITGAGGIAWGGGVDGNPNDGPGVFIAGFDCASCHDPHGSSNYRILKDTVNEVAVGGYAGSFGGDVDPNPQPYVISNEIGFPTYTNPTTDSGAAGFRLHRNYADPAQNPTGVAYAPDFTEAKYAKAPTYAVTGNTPPVGKVATDTDTSAGMSGWCAACHTTYNTTTSGWSLTDPENAEQGEYNADGYDPAVGYGDVVRHRHPVNVALDTFTGDRDLIVGQGTNGTNTPWGDLIDIPLEHNPYDVDDAGAAQKNTVADGTPAGTESDFMGCLTCHRAHGTDTVMTGYADSSSNVNPNQDARGIPSDSGVLPTLSSALLRADNRGVCERCHNK